MILRLILLLVTVVVASGTTAALRRYFANGQIPRRFDHMDVNISDPGTLVVEFTSPYCHECQVAYPMLHATSVEQNAALAVIDAKTRPDLASKYSIRTTPTILVVDSKGKVTNGWKDFSPSREDLVLALVAAGA